MGEPRWSLRFRIARPLHGFVNTLAWRFARPPGPQRGIANRIDRTRLLWRLNYWLAEKWTTEYLDKHYIFRRAALERKDTSR